MSIEKVIYISSVDREKIGVSDTHDFKIKLKETYKLDKDMRHEIAVDSVMMTYSWHNIQVYLKIRKTIRLNILTTVEKTGKQLIFLLVCTVMMI